MRDQYRQVVKYNYQYHNNKFVTQIFPVSDYINKIDILIHIHIQNPFTAACGKCVFFSDRCGACSSRLIRVIKSRQVSRGGEENSTGHTRWRVPLVYLTDPYDQ